MARKPREEQIFISKIFSPKRSTIYFRSNICKHIAKNLDNLKKHDIIKYSIYYSGSKYSFIPAKSFWLKRHGKNRFLVLLVPKRTVSALFISKIFSSKRTTIYFRSNITFNQLRSESKYGLEMRVFMAKRGLHSRFHAHFHSW